MREQIDNSELETIADAASLSRIEVRRPKGAVSGPKKLKGDITDRLQALADELEASRPAPAARPAPVKTKAKVTPASEPAPLREDLPAPLDKTSEVGIETTPGPISGTVNAPSGGALKKKLPLQKLIDQEHAKAAREITPVQADVVQPETDPAPVVEPAPKKGFFRRPFLKKQAPEPAEPTPPPAYMKPPPRRNGWARPAAGQGWRKKAVTPDILTYWMDIREGNRYPSWHNLDIRTVGKYWPSCALVQCDPASGRLQLKPGFSGDLRATMMEEYEPGFEFSPMVLDWIMEHAREVAYSGKPAHGTEFFPAMADEVTLRVIALPLSENQIDIDHVLCYIQKLK
ncbi:MAG: hypothetical protein EP348_10705 [Alphaproteobacteria bacterium]|nr:MAG: hypothetical protein EP348_10705 [Alphaproteobacteria bacterium]